jgi:hypothetical protein
MFGLLMPQCAYLYFGPAFADTKTELVFGHLFVRDATSSSVLC